MGNPASNGTGVYASASYLAVTADTSTPSAGDLTLPGEILSGTLIRAHASYAHTTGASSYTLSNLFVSDQTVVLAKVGVFYVATGGSPFIETLMATPASLNSGDQIQLNEIVTL